MGCWFVPVVNLWMPYQAIRDCLPPAHPGRQQVLYAWVAFLLTLLLSPAALVALVGAPAVGVVLGVVCLAAYATVGLIGHRTVVAIATDHRQAVAALFPR